VPERDLAACRSARDGSERAGSVLADGQRGWQDGKGARSRGGTEIAGEDVTRVGQAMMVHKTKRQRVRCPRAKGSDLSKPVRDEAGRGGKTFAGGRDGSGARATRVGE
jgi:hypothetical protein